LWGARDGGGGEAVEGKKADCSDYKKKKPSRAGGRHLRGPTRTNGSREVEVPLRGEEKGVNKRMREHMKR